MRRIASPVDPLPFCYPRFHPPRAFPNFIPPSPPSYPSPQNRKMARPLTRSTFSTPSGPLELLSSVPDQESHAPPFLCIHGAFCSAHDYQNFLPYFASRGHPAYAVSVRGHGASWQPNWLRRNIFMSLDEVVDDVSAALRHVQETHPALPPPVLIAHSLGGAHVQYFLSRKAEDARGVSPKESVGGLILLASAPLSGGGRITTNWNAAMPSAGLLPWSERPLPDTPGKVRGAFFQDATPEETVETWLRKCRTAEESIRTAIGIVMPVGDAGDILSALKGVATRDGPTRKVLCVAADRDCLVPPDMVVETADVYEGALGTDGEGGGVMRTVIPESGHHLMMDLSWETCAGRIIDWVEGRDVAP